MVREQDSGQLSELRREVRAWLREKWSEDLTVGTWWRLLAEAGYAFPTWPAGMGGRDLGRGEARAITEEIARAGAIGPPGGVGQMVGGPVLIEYGTPEQRRRWVPSLAAGAESWCQLFSEPGAGSDLASLQLRAERDGDRWVLNGQKLWSREAEGADRGLALARTDPSVPKRRGISCFVVDLDQPGVETRPIRQMNGRATFNEVFLTDVVVPSDQMIGEAGQGWRLAQSSLVYERQEVGGGGVLRPARVALPGRRNGMLDRRVGELIEEDRAARRDSTARRGVRTPAALIGLAREVGRSRDPLVRQRIAAVYGDAETNRLRNLSARSARGRGDRPGAEASLGKLAGSAVGRQARDIGLSLLGAEGMLAGPDTTGGGAFQQMALSVPSLSIAGGTDEIQRNLIGERVLGLPREPEADRDVPFHQLRVGTQRK
ncbi:acyl-CoA dehydrogenase family protein [Streptomyces sp. DH37]|nr:acyl-CoA dehydrogenase family protein [Streptomyces sp. DH37]MDG9701992.1 acyl-CoA dehydrogenase family protein [Streptomyces sp. DH37]